MSLQLEKLKDAINTRIFTLPILEVVIRDGETTRIKLAEKYRDSEFILEHQLEDLLNIHTNLKLYTERFKKMVQEIADDQGIKIKFVYSQCIIEVSE